MVNLSIFLPSSLSIYLVWQLRLPKPNRIALAYVVGLFALLGLAYLLLPPFYVVLRSPIEVPEQLPGMVRNLILFGLAFPVNLSQGVNVALWVYLWITRGRVVVELIRRHPLLSLLGIALGPLAYLITLPVWGGYFTLLTLIAGALVVSWAELRAMLFVRLYNWLVREEGVLITFGRRLTGGLGAGREE